MAPGISSSKEGQPQPLSNLNSLLYNGAPQPAQRNVPGSFGKLLPLLAGSVPFCARVTSPQRSQRGHQSTTTYPSVRHESGGALAPQRCTWCSLQGVPPDPPCAHSRDPTCLRM